MVSYSGFMSWRAIFSKLNKMPTYHVLIHTESDNFIVNWVSSVVTSTLYLHVAANSIILCS